MATERPKITTGHLAVPRHLVQRGYKATEQRDYRDGMRLLMLESPNGRRIVAGWDARYGTNAGTVERIHLSPADITAVLRGLRAPVIGAR